MRMRSIFQAWTREEINMSCEGCPNQGKCSKDAGSCSVETNANSKIKHVIAILSGKGGVGKSTITVMLARALAKQGLRVGIMDADITGPSIPRLMNAHERYAYATKENEIIPVEVDGIKIMSLNYLVQNESDPVIWRGPILGNVVKQFYTDVVWGELDVLLIDMPPGTGDVALTILQSLPVQGVLMISTPQPMVSMIVTKAVKMCEQMNVPVLGVIENMAYFQCPNCNEKVGFYDEDELNEFLKESNTKLYGTLPMTDLIRNVHRYDSYDLRQQEQALKTMDQIAKAVYADIQ